LSRCVSGLKDATILVIVVVIYLKDDRGYTDNKKGGADLKAQVEELI
jgi:hypothetical protein